MELAGRIHPLVRDGDGCLRAIQPVELRASGFHRGARMMERVVGLDVVAEVRTSHAGEPSVAEVLAQIPVGHLGSVTHFESVIEVLAGEASNCVAKTVLYSLPSA